MALDERTAARALAALGHEMRLRIYRLLVRAGADGLIVSEIAEHVVAPASTLSHHLRALVSAGLVVQERQGREVLNRADFDTMNRTLTYLTDECCQGVSLLRKDVA